MPPLSAYHQTVSIGVFVLTNAVSEVTYVAIPQFPFFALVPYGNCSLPVPNLGPARLLPIPTDHGVMLPCLAFRKVRCETLALSL